MKRVFDLTHWLVQHWMWWVRLGLLWLLVGQIAPPPQRVFPQPMRTVEAAQPHVCVHTELINEPDEWKIQHSLDMVREMGASTIVEFFPWAYLQPGENTFNWAQADKIVKHAQQNGIRIIARMGLVPGWVQPEDTQFTLNTLPESAFDDFAAFVAAFAARYAGTIDHLIIWNEPNLAFEWGFQLEGLDPAYYTRLLKAVYAPVHAANPDVIILAGALAPTLEPAGSPNGLNDVLYLEGMYAAGAGAYFDALAVHTYGFEHPAMMTPEPGVLNFRRVELLRAMMVRYGDAEKAVMITESGWNDNARWVRGVRPSQRVAYTLDALELVETAWDWGETMCLWIFRYPRDHGNYRDNFTLVTSEFQPKPIYYAVQAYARGWALDDTRWLPPPEETLPQ
ncbi:MAG: hypothetical protein OHK0046_03920 [Anaerolineae bacterium]